MLIKKRESAHVKQETLFHSFFVVQGVFSGLSSF